MWGFGVNNGSSARNPPGPPEKQLRTSAGFPGRTTIKDPASSHFLSPPIATSWLRCAPMGAIQQELPGEELTGLLLPLHL